MKPTRLLRPWDFPGKSTGVGCHFLLQGLFLTQGSNPGFPHYGKTLYPQTDQGSPKTTNNKLSRLGRKGNPSTLLVGMEIDTTVMENSTEQCKCPSTDEWIRTSLIVQWLRRCASNAGVPSLAGELDPIKDPACWNKDRRLCVLQLRPSSAK